MNKLIISFILFFSISISSFSQENNSDLIRLSKLIFSDSLLNRTMQKKVYFIKERVEQQIQGAGAKEKLATYIKFIDTQSAELLKTFSTVAIPQIYTKHFTANEIKDLIQFYETPNGKALLSEMNEIICSFRFEFVETPLTSNMEFSSENKKDVEVFYKTPTGKKFHKSINTVITELMTSLHVKYLPDFQQKLKKELQRLDSKIWREAYLVKPEQVTVHNGEFSGSKKLLRIVNDTIAQETYITFAVPIFDNKWWIRFDKNTKIIDKDSNEHYQIVRLDRGLVLNKTMIVSGQKYKMIEVTMVFPLLKNSIDSFDLVEEISGDADLMSNNNGDGGKSIMSYTKVED